MYVLGIDGGATKTTVALADQKGNILSKEVGGLSSPRNIGIEATVDVIASLFPQEKISSSFVALPGMEEEYSDKKDLLADMLKERGLSGKIVVGSDQLCAFRSTTTKEDGVVVIAGTGSVVRGWKEGRQFACGGWGYLADEGSAFYIGLDVFRAVTKDVDKRSKTAMRDIVFKEWSISCGREMQKKVYSDFKKFIPQMSLFADMAAKNGDSVAKEILQKGSRELLLSFWRVAQELQFKEDFDVVLSGGMFCSEEFLFLFKEGVFELCPHANTVIQKDDPVRGAVALALDNLIS